jgi:hypothetical protein
LPLEASIPDGIDSWMKSSSRVSSRVAAAILLSSLATGAPVSAQERHPPARAALPPAPAPAPIRPRWTTPGLLIGGGLAAVGVGVGVGFSIAALNRYSAAFDERTRLAFHTVVDQPICPDHASSARCGPLRALVEARNTDRSVAIAGFTAGAIGVGVALFSAWRGRSVAYRAPLSIMPSREGVVVTGTF